MRTIDGVDIAVAESLWAYASVDKLNDAVITPAARLGARRVI